MASQELVLDKSKLKEGVRFCKVGSDVVLYSANGIVIDRLVGTDIAECVEALQRQKLPYNICVQDTIVQVTR